MHDYQDSSNPSRATVKARRQASAEGTRRHRDRQKPKAPPPADEQLDLDDVDTDPAPEPRRISADWEPSREDIKAAQLARVEAGRPQLTADQVDALTAKFVRRMADDGTRAAAWGGRWRQWAESERTDPAPSPSGVVVPFGQQKPTKSQQQRAGLDRLRAKYEGGTA
jgi:hypothetical protein